MAAALLLLITAVFLLDVTRAAPSSESRDPEEISLVDQRQNGTENYRIEVKDVAVIWAPIDALIAAAALLDGDDFFGFDEKPQKPIVESVGNATEGSAEGPTTSTTENPPSARSRNKFRLFGNLGPFVRRLQQRY